MPELVRAALVHVQFVTIHPFLDGNGRIGRLVFTVMLAAAGILRELLLDLSLYLKAHRAEYDRLLSAVRVDGDWEAWLDFILEGVDVTAAGAVDAAHRLLALMTEDRARVGSLNRSNAAATAVFRALCDRPVLTVKEVRRRTACSYPTAARGMEALLELGILRELTGRRRDRIFAYDRYLAILAEGTEPA